MRERKTRDGIAGFRSVYRDAWQAYKEFGSATAQALLFTVLIPVHLLYWLWLPECSAEAREARAKARKEWMDADV